MRKVVGNKSLALIHVSVGKRTRVAAEPLSQPCTARNSMNPLRVTIPFGIVGRNDLFVMLINFDIIDNML